MAENRKRVNVPLSDRGGHLREVISEGLERRRSRDTYDYNLLAAVILLTCFGLVMLYSTSAYEAQMNHGSDMFYFRKQALISLACIIGVVVGSQIDYHLYSRFTSLFYLGSMAFLVATKFVGREINGAKRWIYISGISFQPAEMAKLAVILLLPTIIVKMGKKMRGIIAPVVVLGVGGICALFTFYFTENLSTALIIAAITYFLVFIVYPDTGRFLLVSGIIAAIGILIIAVVLVKVGSDTSSFRLMRILVWLHPEEYSDEGGYQVMQGLYAIGSGGFFGKGLGNSAQKLGALPEAHNDMIFSIICEELGLFGALIVVLLFVFLLSRLYVIARNAPDLLGSLIVTGVFIHISLQVVLNIAVVINMIPTTGITLPFVSYGGTSILFLMLEMMVALSVSRHSGR